MNVLYVLLGAAITVGTQYVWMRREQARWRRRMMNDPFYRMFTGGKP